MSFLSAFVRAMVTLEPDRADTMHQRQVLFQIFFSFTFELTMVTLVPCKSHVMFIRHVFFQIVF